MSQSGSLEGVLSSVAGLWAALPDETRRQALDCAQQLGAAMGRDLPPEVADQMLAGGDLEAFLEQLRGIDAGALQAWLQQGLADPQVQAAVRGLGQMLGPR